MFRERKSATAMFSRRKWQETGMKSALHEVKRDAVSIRDAGVQYKIPESDICSRKKFGRICQAVYPAEGKFFLAI